VQTNCVMLGSANEVHLAAFREHPEFPSFRGRFELVKAPYLRSYVDEQEHLRRADRAASWAATWRPTRRARPPSSPCSRAAAARSEALPGQPRASRVALTALEKMDLYATGTPPERLDARGNRSCSSPTWRAVRESEVEQVDFEGGSASRRARCERCLLDAAQSAEYRVPVAVRGALRDRRAVQARLEFDWLREKPLAGGYHDHALSSASSCGRAARR
jgi:serine protein kinase